MPSSLFARRLSFWLLLATGVVLLDQLSKLWVVQHFLLGESQPVTGFFNLVRAHNPGAAFSFLAGAGGWQRWFFVALALAAAGVIVWMLKRHPGHWVFNLALAMILGGAVGNVIDRIAYGHVVDFLQFHWELLTPLFPGGYFPAFNLADSAITFGAFCLIADELRRMRHGDNPPPSAP